MITDERFFMDVCNRVYNKLKNNSSIDIGFFDKQSNNGWATLYINNAYITSTNVWENELIEICNILNSIY